MNDRIQRLKVMSSLLEPSRETRAQWTDQVVAHAERFIGSVAAGPALCLAPNEGKGILSARFREEPEDPASLLKLLADHVQGPGGRLGHPGFLGFIPISSVYPAALGDYLAAVINPFAGNFFASPGAVRLEHLLTRWMAEFVGYPRTATGDLTSGGSIANLTAIVTARETHGLKGRDYSNAVVYLTGQTHHSVTKALRIAGLSECVRRDVPLDSAYRMRSDLLEQLIGEDKKAGLVPWLVVASAGSTDAGAIDPLPSIAQIAQHHHLWLHVDGAYGAMFALCEPGRRALSGIELSDSLTLDPHKGLFMPCGSGAILVKDGQTLFNAYSYEAHYLQDRPALASLDEVSPSELSPELTRPFRGLRLWLSLKLIGLQAFRAALEEKLLLARYFHEQIRKQERVEVGPPPDLSVVTFRYTPERGDPDEFNRRVLQALHRDGRIFLTSTRLNGRFWLRVAVLCATTHGEHIDLAIKVLKQAALETVG
jgi:glutamate/tyrosine decarboxylase-like PLP-dependent enzyme